MLLSALILLPLVGALPLLTVRDRNAQEIKVWAFIVAFVTFLVSLPLWTNYLVAPGLPLYQFVERYPWIRMGGLNIDYAVGVDGVSALLILLTTFLTPIALLGSWNYIKERQKEFYIAMLVLETAMIGVFAATDLFLFYVFFEASLIPMYLIIGIWGGEDRLYATTKFVIYTVFGSLLMFVAILWVYFKASAGLPEGEASFGITQLADRLEALRLADKLTASEEKWCFWAFALAFSIKVPLFPLHTWLPDAHVEAPTPGSVILAGVLLKMGGYGFLRLIVPFFPDAAAFYAPFFSWICVIGIVYGSLLAFAQKDIKKLIAYSSVAHLGVCMLGIFSYREIGVQGGVYQMLNHGISTGALFLLVGMLYERAHTRTIDYFGGIAKVVPAYTVCFVIVTLSSIGLPLTNGFIGEFASLLGAFQADPKVHGIWGKAYAGLGGLGVILGAAYMLYLVKRVFFGRLIRASNEHLHDLTGRELGLLLPLLIMIFVMGIAPTPFFRRMEPAVKEFLRAANREAHGPEVMAIRNAPGTEAGAAPGRLIPVAQVTPSVTPAEAAKSPPAKVTVASVSRIGAYVVAEVQILNPDEKHPRKFSTLQASFLDAEGKKLCDAIQCYDRKHFKFNIEKLTDQPHLGAAITGPSHRIAPGQIFEMVAVGALESGAGEPARATVSLKFMDGTAAQGEGP